MTPEPAWTANPLTVHISPTFFEQTNKIRTIRRINFEFLPIFVDFMMNSGHFRAAGNERMGQRPSFCLGKKTSVRESTGVGTSELAGMSEGRAGRHQAEIWEISEATRQRSSRGSR